MCYKKISDFSLSLGSFPCMKNIHNVTLETELPNSLPAAISIHFIIVIPGQVQL